MQTYIGRRLVATLFTLFGVSIVVFLLLRLIPGSIIDAILGQGARSPEVLKDMRAFFGLDAPLWLQYIRWIRDLIRGDLGTCWRGGMPVMDVILERFPLTLELTLLAMLMTITVGVPLGVLSAVYKDSAVDNAFRLISFVSLGLPNFWLGAMMILVCSKFLHWMPPMEFVSIVKDPLANLKMVALPALALGTANVANILRVTRGAMLEVLSQDYIRTARAKGLTERVVTFRHALKNCLIVVITVAGMMTGYLFGGAVTVEAVFLLPGMGRLLITSIYTRDYPAIRGVLLFTCALFVLINFFVDILYSWINPRIRYA